MGKAKEGKKKLFQGTALPLKRLTGRKRNRRGEGAGRLHFLLPCGPKKGKTNEKRSVVGRFSYLLYLFFEFSKRKISEEKKR